MKQLILGIIVSIFLTSLSSHSAQSAYAVTVPQYPSCVAPSGLVKVSYPNGTHGIVGSSLDYTGSDTVYQINSDQVTQCFCPNDGNGGIQTNWLNTTGLSQEDIDVLKHDGWILIPNGTLWGLDEGSYLAKNIDFTCKGGTGSSNGQTQSASGSVLAGAIQALAGTGNTVIMITIFLIGLLLLSAAVALRKFQK